MRIAILSSPDSWYLQDLLRAAGGRHELHCVNFGRLAARWEQRQGWRLLAEPHDLTCFDAALIRTMPPGSLEQVVFRMDLLARWEAAGVLVVNPPKAIEVAVDKYLASARLQAAGLPTPRTLVCQTVEDAMAGFAELGGKVVVKPLFGSEGRGILRVEDQDLASRVFKTLTKLDAVLYLQEFIPHLGYDIRLLVIGDRVLGMRRLNPLDWRTNVSRGAVTEPFAPDDELVALARTAAAAVAAPLAGVDLLPAQDGRRYVLEVNAVPGWKALSRTLQVDVAKLVLDYLETAPQETAPRDVDRHAPNG
jgi:RimK family alpha-L-glutamate ligase